MNYLIPAEPEKLKTFDEWFQQEYGRTYENEAFNMWIPDAMKLLARAVRDYATYAAQYKETA